MYKKFTPVEACLNIFDQNRLWWYIPGFNGYEISTDGFIRSMKHYRKYPYGIMIRPVNTKKEQGTTDPLFELSDNNNERQRIRLSQLAYLAKNNSYIVSGYPRLTIISDGNPRNDPKFIVKNKPKMPLLDNNAHYAKFTIIQDGTEAIDMTPVHQELQVPLIPLKGNDKFYGREDIRTFSNRNVQAGSGEIFSRG